MYTKTKAATSTHMFLTAILIKLFNRAIQDPTTVIPFGKMNEIATKLGYLVHPDVCNTAVYTWLKEQSFNFNTTFYQKWHDVISKSRFELYIDQLFHYVTTYGTDFQLGQGYVPNPGADVPPFTEFKAILPITREEVIQRVEKMLFSGIALKQDTIEELLFILRELEYTIDVKRVRNKEAKMFLFKELNQLPDTAEEMVRMLVYIATGKTLVIKNKETIDAIKASGTQITGYIYKFGEEKLASVFHRYKPIFLAFKGVPKNNSSTINRLRRLADKHHKPLKQGFWETILSDGVSSTGDLRRMLEKSNITNFKKILLLQTINIRNKHLGNNAYVIRNQKLYVKEGDKKLGVRARKEQSYSSIYTTLYNSLVESMKPKACKIALPDKCTLTLPTSEKSFIGNYPLGTSFDFSDSDNIVGVYWRNEWGANDLDLSLTTVDGKKYGWNAAYTNRANSVIYSGDMTNADPEATELFYASKHFAPAIVNVNRYSGAENSKFRFFMAREHYNNAEHAYSRAHKPYMVNPNNIIMNVECEMDSKQKCLGVITGDRFVLAQFRTGKGRVSFQSVTDLYTDYALSTLDCYIDLKRLLIDAGFTITNSAPDIDLREVTKDSLISLIS